MLPGRCARFGGGAAARSRRARGTAHGR